VGDDVTEVSSAVRQGLPEMAGAGLTVGLTVVGLGVLDWRLGLAGLVAAPIQARTVRWYLRRAGPLYAAERAAGSARAQQVLDSVGGAATVRAYGLGEEHARRVRDRSADAMELSLQTVRIQTRFHGRQRGRAGRDLRDPGRRLPPGP
jgi:ATP-binding cassette subfamily C protein